MISKKAISPMLAVGTGTLRRFFLRFISSHPPDKRDNTATGTDRGQGLEIGTIGVSRVDSSRIDTLGSLLSRQVQRRKPRLQLLKGSLAYH
jgi:hypothetical protein